MSKEKLKCTVLNKEPQSVSRGASLLAPKCGPSRGDETAIVGDAACSPEQHASVEDTGFQGSDDIPQEAESPYLFVAGWLCYIFPAVVSFYRKY